MIFRRLRLQIYLTIVMSLVAIVVVSALTWSLFVRDRIDRSIFERARLVIFTALPDADAPLEEQKKVLAKFGTALKVDISLYGANGTLQGDYGPTIAIPEFDADDEDDWAHEHEQGPNQIFSLRLPDDRLLLVRTKRKWKRKPVLGLLLLLSIAAGTIGLAAYPFVRRLTGRLERLQAGVEKVGRGDLSARVNVEGKDEVARLAQSFNEATATIEQLLNSQKLLLANASHELRTPLSRIRLGIAMLEENNDPKRREALREDIAELDDLIDEILLTSRLDGGAVIDRIGSTDLMGLIAEEAARFDQCELAGEPVDMNGDPRLLTRMIRNLIDNAHKHGKPPVTIDVSQDGGMAVIVVSDGGDGIAEKDYESVFQAFFRGKGKQNTKGYGLGLPLVKQIAEAHGGSVTILPKDQASSAIEVRLPIGP